ncbi:MAG: hypothetical protein OIF57_01310 [Marinobacterium sp.]|nr:hypothetical protein [Marinobacterium sp.]
MGVVSLLKDANRESVPEFEEYLRERYDVVGIEELEQSLRKRITDYLASSYEINGKQRKGSYNLLSQQTGISHTFIWKFHTKEQAICIANMNKLANFFSVRYFVDNF